MVREYRRIIEFAKTASGGTPSRDRLDYFKGNIRWVTTSELRDSYIEDTNEHISKEAVANSSAKVFPANTLLMAMYGATIGRLGIIANEAATNQACCAIFPDNTVDTKYLFYCLLYDRKNIVEKGCGAGQPNISQDIIKNIEVPYCDLVEQKAIAIALSDVDELILNLEKLIEKKKAIKQGTMHDLLNGKKRLPGFTEQWKSETFGNLCVICRGGSPRPIQAYLTTQAYGINWIKIGDVKPNAKYITSTQEKIIEAGAARSRRVYKGDFILSNSMSFGRPYILKLDGCIHDGWLAIQEYQKSFDTDFLYYLLGADYVFEQYIQMAAGSSVQNLNKEKVAQLIVCIPPVEEQKAIASILSDMDSEINRLEGKLDKYRMVKQGMMQKLLTGEIRLV